MKEVPFEEWQKLELRVGQITSIENHPNADKLYVLKVDIGTETRTLVAGLKKHYAKESLINQKVIVLANIQPAVLRGVKSEGMILAAVDEKEGKVVVLQPEKEIAPGSIVR